MKRFISLVLCIATTILCFASCSKKIAEEGDVSVVIEVKDGEYEIYKTYLENVEYKHEGLLAVIKNLHARPRDPLHVEYTDESFSPRICEIGPLKEGDGKYIVYYTSVETDSFFGAPTVVYGDTLLHMAGIGVEMAEVPSGAVFLFRLEANPF